MRAEFIVECSFRGCVHDTGVALPGKDWSQPRGSKERVTDLFECTPESGEEDLLVCNEYLPSTHHLCERDASIFLPLLDRLLGINEDDEIFVLALVMDLGLACVAAHCRLWEVGMRDVKELEELSY